MLDTRIETRVKNEIRRSIERIEERDNRLRYMEIFTLFRIEYLTAKKSSRFPFRTVLSFFNYFSPLCFSSFHLSLSVKTTKSRNNYIGLSSLQETKYVTIYSIKICITRYLSISI